MSIKAPRVRFGTPGEYELTVVGKDKFGGEFGLSSAEYTLAVVVGQGESTGGCNVENNEAAGGIASLLLALGALFIRRRRRK